MCLREDYMGSHEVHVAHRGGASHNDFETQLCYTSQVDNEIRGVLTSQVILESHSDNTSHFESEAHLRGTSQLIDEYQKDYTSHTYL